jgi:hypothetical protein
VFLSRLSEIPKNWFLILFGLLNLVLWRQGKNPKPIKDPL